MAETRFDPIKRKWVVISPERGGRRDSFMISVKREQDSSCPFCSIEDVAKLPPLYRIDAKDGSGKAALVVTPDKYPVMGIEGKLERFGDGLYDAVSGIGAHEIIIDSPRHSLAAADYTEEEIYNLFLAFKVRLEDLAKDIRFRYAAAFKNIGFEAGEIINHPHAQIIASPMVPSGIENTVVFADAYYREKERCLFCDIMKKEREEKSRVITENYEFTAFCPYASEYPFEVAVYPKKHEAFYSGISDNSLRQLADIVKELFSRMSALLGSPAISLALRLAPFKCGRPDLSGYMANLESSFHYRLELRPAVTPRTGTLWACGLPINVLKPEEAAQYLREVSSI